MENRGGIQRAVHPPSGAHTLRVKNVRRRRRRATRRRRTRQEDTASYTESSVSVTHTELCTRTSLHAGTPAQAPWRKCQKAHREEGLTTLFMSVSTKEESINTRKYRRAHTHTLCTHTSELALWLRNLWASARILQVFILQGLNLSFSAATLQFGCAVGPKISIGSLIRT